MAAMPGKVKRRLQHREQGDQQQQVESQRQRRDDAEEAVVDAHEERDRGEAVDHAVEALRDVLGTEARADRPLLDDLHRRGERAGAQQQRVVVGLGRGHPTRDLDPAAELGADHRRGDDLALALLEQQDRHALADVLARNVLDDARALGVERQVDDRLLGLRVEARLGIGEVVAGQHDLALDDQRRSAALDVTLGAERHRPVSGGRGQRLGTLVDHAQLERRGAADDVLGLRGVLHARQLDDDAVGALLLDHRLGDAELVDAVVQRGDVLGDRRRLDPARASGFSEPTRRRSPPSALSCHSRSGS